MSLRPSPYFLRRAPTYERALLFRHLGHPCGVLVADNDVAPRQRCAGAPGAAPISFHCEGDRP